MTGAGHRPPGGSGTAGGGELVIVATPIGNLADLAPRAAEVLASADVICCEDTRHSGLLLQRSGVTARRLLSLHGHNEAVRIAEVVELVAAGKRVAVVSDAGTPGVSDPGALVVSAVHDAGLRVSTVPGPSAAVAAISVAGLGDGRWHFEGFLPRRGRDRADRLTEIAASRVPSVLYESPLRVDALLSELAGRCGGDRTVVVCRELTKLHEEVWRGALSDSVARWPSASAKGEFVIVLGGAPEPPAAEAGPGEIAALVAEAVAAGATRRDAVAEVAERLAIARRVVYEAATGGPKHPPTGPCGPGEAGSGAL